jgi:hypothetical protein
MLSVENICGSITRRSLKENNTVALQERWVREISVSFFVTIVMIAIIYNLVAITVSFGTWVMAAVEATPREGTNIGPRSSMAEHPALNRITGVRFPARLPCIM